MSRHQSWAHSRLKRTPLPPDTINGANMDAVEQFLGVFNGDGVRRPKSAAATAAAASSSGARRDTFVMIGVLFFIGVLLLRTFMSPR
jgi:hypothetical protein